MRGLLAALYGSGLVPVQVPKHKCRASRRGTFAEGVLTPTPLKHIGLPSEASNMFLPLAETTRRLLPTREPFLSGQQCVSYFGIYLLSQIFRIVFGGYGTGIKIPYGLPPHE
ncbi:hypothetical protein SAMD00079811_56570 [Scytonema sp. HK-05]|nr:hypothetical protein SAMD00079811_56570 [Scytonema sp. HK-05]